MKYVKYALGAIVILAIGFLSVGLIRPQVSYESEIMVGKSLAEVWAVIMDEEKLPEWLPGLQGIEHVSGTPGTVGAVSDVYFDDNGQTMSIRETITGLVPEESIAMSYTSDFMDMDYGMTVTPVNGQVRIGTATVAKGNGMFARSIMALMGNSLSQQEETNLSNLKRAIEQNTKDYSQTAETPDGTGGQDAESF